METIDRNLLTFVLNALWQVPLAAMVAALACRLMRNGPARHRHAVCVAGLIAALLLPVASMRRGSADVQTIAVPQTVEMTASGQRMAQPAAATIPTPRTVPLPRTAASLALWGLALFLCVRVGRLAAAGWKTVRICRDARPGGDCPAWDRCRAAFALDDVELRWSSTISGPVTAGKLVILPVAMQGAPDDVLATAIGHELAHIARRDFASNVVYELLCLPISFQPATAWLRRHIDRTRELACDELVTARLLAPEVYARSIMDIAATMSGVARRGYTLGVFDGDILEERIKRLVHRPAANLKRARMLLAAGLAGMAACVVIASTLAITARAQSPAQQEMRQAADAYNSGDFASATEHFKKAVMLEPDNIKARLFLAASYLRQDRPALAPNARTEYQEVLRLDPKNRTAVFGIITLNGAARAAESHDLIMKLIDSDPKSKEAYYTAGVLDWMIAFGPIRDANGGNGPAMYHPIADPSVRAALRAQLLPHIEEGYRMLQIALDLDPGMSDAMAYMNLLLRLNAALVDDPAESTAFITQADAWVGKALAAIKANPRSRQSGPERIDVDGPAPTAVPSMMIPAPPPPPPPPGAVRENKDHK
jgi:beta-lactamase regulating signal transducer with metallopeptidase domain